MNQICYSQLIAMATLLPAGPGLQLLTASVKIVGQRIEVFVCLATSRKPEPHVDVKNAGLQVRLADRRKAAFLVKLPRLDLRAKNGFGKAAPARLANQGFEYGSANALPAARGDDCHAPDAAVGQQAAGADCVARVIDGERVYAFVVDGVPLHFQRDLLLDDKNGFTDALRRGAEFFPAGDANGRAHA